MEPENTSNDPKLRRNLKIIIWLSIFGILVSSYLTYSHYQEEKDPFCEALGGGCDIVNKGVYSELDGIINQSFDTYIDFPFPVSVIGALGFLITIILSFMILKDKYPTILKIYFGRKYLVKLMFWLNAFGWLFALYLTYIEFIVLGTFCPFCDITKTAFTIVLVLCWINLKYVKKNEK